MTKASKKLHKALKRLEKQGALTLRPTSHGWAVETRNGRTVVSTKLREQSEAKARADLRKIGIMEV